MRVLLLARYNWGGNSSRHRTLKYLPYLRSQGIDVTTAPLFDDAYVAALYAGRRRNPIRLVRDYASRAYELVGSTRYDLVWIERELFPMMPAIAEGLLARSGVRYVVDYDDAIFHNYDHHRSGLVRTLLGGKIDAVMRNAAMVVVGNAYLAQRARAAGAGRIECLPTAIDTDKYPARPPRPRADFTIGWIGTPPNARYLIPIRDALAELTSDPETHLILIGAGHVELPGVRLEIRPWVEETEARDIGEFDVGIMPVPDAPFERGKCGFKILQYFASGRPAVASPVGLNTEIVEDGLNGFLASSPDDWVRAIDTLRRDPDRRVQMGRAGRERVERLYSTAAVGPRLAALLREAASG